MRALAAVICFLLLALAGTADVSAQAVPAAGDPELRELERRAENAYEEDDLEAALGLYRQLEGRLTDTAERARIVRTIAWLEHLSGRDAAASAALLEALLAAPEQPFRRELYSEAFAQLFYDAQKKALERREQVAAESLHAGTEAMRRGDHERARRLLDEALAASPDHPTALYNRAVLDLQQERQEEALAGFQKVLALRGPRGEEISPEVRAKALTNVGLLYNARGLHQEAEEALAEAVALDPANSQAWTNLGSARRRLGQTAAAAEAFQRAYQLAPESAAAIDNLALAHIDARDWASAVALLSDATRRFPDRPRLWMTLGLARLGLGDGAGASNAFEAAIDADPVNAEGIASAAAIRLARYHYERGEAERTLEQASRALVLQRDLADGWIYQGLAEQSLGRHQAARESLEEARRLDPARAETHNNLGSVYYDLGLLDLAEAAFERALAIRPDLAAASANLEAVRRERLRGGAGRGPLPIEQPAAPPSAPAGAGRIDVGLRFADVDYSALGLKGAMVEAVEPGSPAARAGLRAGDLLLKVDGRDVTSAGGFLAYLGGASGSSVTLDLLRDNRPQRLELRLP